MKTLRSISFLFSLLLLLPACSGQEGEYEQQFKSYLNKTFSLHPKEGVIYCFLPANQCRYCTHYDGKWLPSVLRNRFVILSGFPESDYPNFPEVHYDWKDEMLFLDFLDYGNHFVIYKNRRIQSIWITDFYKQLDSLALHS